MNQFHQLPDQLHLLLNRAIGTPSRHHSLLSHIPSLKSIPSSSLIPSSNPPRSWSSRPTRASLTPAPGSPLTPHLRSHPRPRDAPPTYSSSRQCQANRFSRQGRRRGDSSRDREVEGQRSGRRRDGSMQETRWKKQDQRIDMIGTSFIVHQIVLFLDKIEPNCASTHSLFIRASNTSAFTPVPD